MGAEEKPKYTEEAENERKLWFLHLNNAINIINFSRIAIDSLVTSVSVSIITLSAGFAVSHKAILSCQPVLYWAWGFLGSAFMLIFASHHLSIKSNEKFATDLTNRIKGAKIEPSQKSYCVKWNSVE